MNDNSKKARERRGSGLWVFLVSLGLLATILWTIGIAWGVRRALLAGPQSDGIMSERQKSAVMAIAEFPVFTRAAFQYVLGQNPLLFSRAEKERPWWVRRFPAPEDNGYLLFSGLYAHESAPTVKLVRIADGQVVASWNPDWPAVLAKTTRKKFDFPTKLTNVAAVNPVLLDDASIIFSTGNASARVAACSREPMWVLNETMHHSTSLDVDGRSFWSPSVDTSGFKGNALLRSVVRNDAVAQVSLDGKLLERRPFSDISNDNGLDYLLFNGNSAGDFNADPIHMNEIKVAPSDSRFWKKGDLLISLRNPNTVLLYRPSTRQVVWHQTGPWLHQHSVDFINDHQISIFNNNVVLKSPAESTFLTPQSINEVMVFDFETNLITQPFQPLLQAARPRTVAEGRSRVLPDGGLFLEETESGRILRFTKDKLLWSFVNDHDDKTIGAVSWSSYLTADEARKPLAALAAAHCVAASAPSNGS